MPIDETTLPMPRAPRSPRLLSLSIALIGLIGSLLVSSISQAAPPPLEPTSTEAPRVAEAPPLAEAARVAPAPTLVAPSCSTDDSLSLTGSNLWEGLRDKPIVLSLKDGVELIGTVVEQSSEQLAFARASDGTVVAVAKRDVAGIHVRASAMRPDAPPREGLSDDGRKHTTGGVMLLTFGSMFALSGTVMLALCPECLYIHLPLLLPGAAMIGGGVALVKSGKRKRAEYERSWGIASRARIAPSFSVGREGGHAGVVLRF